MIFVGGLPFSNNNSSSSSSSSSRQGSDTLVALLENPILVSASQSLTCMEDTKVSFSEETSIRFKYVYVFQREYATVDPTLVDVHLIGGFDDVSPNHANLSTGSGSYTDLDGYSFPLCTKLVDAFQRRSEKFHIQTLHVLGNNTKRDSQGFAYPMFHGLVVETSTGSLSPASFDGTSRCPDEIVRRIRVTSSHEDSSWNGKLLETYDTQTDRFVIAPCLWTLRQLYIVTSLQHLSDAEILLTCSTSPSAEGPDFVENLRRQWNYLIQHPSWRETFPLKQPRIFERTADGGWRRC